MDKNDLQKRFTYHPATGLQPGFYGAIRAACFGLAELINALCPEGREKTIAVTKLEEVMFWANASIARSHDEEDEIRAPNSKI